MLEGEEWQEEQFGRAAEKETRRKQEGIVFAICNTRILSQNNITKKQK